MVASLVVAGDGDGDGDANAGISNSSDARLVEVLRSKPLLEAKLLRLGSRPHRGGVRSMQAARPTSCRRPSWLSLPTVLAAGEDVPLSPCPAQSTSFDV